jgi:isoamylase
MPNRSLQAGQPFPLGATLSPDGIGFALFSQHAERVELCLFEGSRETRLEMPAKTGHIFHAFLPGGKSGQVYGYRVYGPYRPLQGHRFNPHKLLLDPYARRLVGNYALESSDFGYQLDHPEGDLSYDTRDNAATAIKAQVVAEQPFDWQSDQPPGQRRGAIIYEAHLKGLTQLHPEIPEPWRGRYLGMSHPAIIRHLQKLGVTAVEFLPIHSMLDDRRLRGLGLTNYWGYSTLNFFCPTRRYAQDDPVREFKTMVRALHQAGIEVILDVVYNHTAEGSHLGPTLSFRGLDNASYYRLDPDLPRYYRDTTGCGNTLNLNHPQVLQLVMDSLRFWVQEMHVDGFRFDLTPALTRGQSAFLAAVHQDPILKCARMIAEPWDLGPNGYQVGRFPVGWAEWNDRYRDTLRRFWRADSGTVSQLATRLSGSSDLYSQPGRAPADSVNFITCHDGFTLADLVSYSNKHNLANGEDNRDGSDHNCSSNYGHEGPHPGLRAFRLRRQMAMLASLYLSRGTPMILAGDELGRTQQGNNNAYCQDNHLSWLDWSQIQPELADYCQHLAQIRAQFPELAEPEFAHQEVTWLHPQGRLMKGSDWGDGQLHSLGMLLRSQQQSLLWLMHAGPQELHWTLPKGLRRGWKIELLNYPEAGDPWLLPSGGVLLALRLEAAPKAQKNQRKTKH